MASESSDMKKKFCPNCGTENGADDLFCKECGMPFGQNVYGAASPTPGRRINQTPAGKKANRKRILTGGICAAAAVLVLAVGIAAVRRLAMTPEAKVLHAVAATAAERPEMIDDLKAVRDILMESRYTAGLSMEVDGEGISSEVRNSTADKQISMSVDVDNLQFDLLTGVHSGAFKAAVSDWDYVFTYDPKRDNEGYLLENMREKWIEQLNSVLEGITSNQTNVKELQKEMLGAMVRESEELEWKEAKTKQFEVDGKERECEGYKVRIDENDIAHFVEAAGEVISKKQPGSLADEYSDMMDDLADAIERDSSFDAEATFYLYKKKLAAAILEINDDSDVEWAIEFLGGDYRIQNMLISMKYDQDTYQEVEINSRKKGSVETVTIEAETGESITIAYDTKSGEISMEYDDGWTEFFIEGIYKHSSSEASFTLREFEVDGDSLLEDEDVDLMLYVGKDVEIQEYRGSEFDLGSAEEDDFEELVEDLREDSELFAELFYEDGAFVGLAKLYRMQLFPWGTSYETAAPAYEEP